MFQKGDIVEVIESYSGNKVSPGIKKGDRYVVNDTLTCNCKAQYIDIGLSHTGKQSNNSKCVCGIGFGRLEKPFYHHSFFRKIEPLYRTVEISESINKQELILN